MSVEVSREWWECQWTDAVEGPKHLVGFVLDNFDLLLLPAVFVDVFLVWRQKEARAELVGAEGGLLPPLEARCLCRHRRALWSMNARCVCSNTQVLTYSSFVGDLASLFGG